MSLCAPNNNNNNNNKSELYTLQESKEFRTKQARKGEMTTSVNFSVSRTSIVCEVSTAI